MLTRRVVENHDVAAFPLQKPVLEKSEEQHATRTAAGKLDDMGEFPVTLRPVPKQVRLVRIVALGPPYSSGNRKLGYREHHTITVSWRACESVRHCAVLVSELH